MKAAHEVAAELVAAAYPRFTPVYRALSSIDDELAPESGILYLLHVPKGRFRATQAAVRELLCKAFGTERLPFFVSAVSTEHALKHFPGDCRPAVPAIPITIDTRLIGLSEQSAFPMLLGASWPDITRSTLLCKLVSEHEETRISVGTGFYLVKAGPDICVIADVAGSGPVITASRPIPRSPRMPVEEYCGFTFAPRDMATVAELHLLRSRLRHWATSGRESTERVS
jgi:hypothetical protein